MDHKKSTVVWRDREDKRLTRRNQTHKNSGGSKSIWMESRFWEPGSSSWRNQRQDCLRRKLLVGMMKSFETRESELLHNPANTPTHTNALYPWAGSASIRREHSEGEQGPAWATVTVEVDRLTGRGRRTGSSRGPTLPEWWHTSEGIFGVSQPELNKETLFPKYQTSLLGAVKTISSRQGHS